LIKKAAIYARIVSPDDDIQPQISGLRKLARQRGFEAVEYKDIVSGANANGPWSA
jgi:DNA invertase Pin-like site-specific DNA recombinase